ncbi:hypothetical protein BLS_001805 [Venturia inaequalis]|uniref:Uncharacterized protein n=1 Tax=Venturia inaequalis TaxID=5025 RepID=A0A8H3YZJ8_VENIN|nr:hypothetical protein BLS_001805 [Venturia inaequalis]KAE9979629.1 hypothetical protein EG327_006947 [Venturia inaequalis]
MASGSDSRRKTGVFGLGKMLGSISTLRHLSDCMCGKGKCKRNSYNRQENKHPENLAATDTDEEEEEDMLSTSSTSSSTIQNPNHGTMTPRQSAAVINELKQQQQRSHDKIVRLVNEIAQQKASWEMLYSRTRSLSESLGKSLAVNDRIANAYHAQSARVASLSCQLQKVREEMGTCTNGITGQNEDLRAENEALCRRVKELGVQDLGSEKMWLEEEVLNQGAKAAFLQDAIKGLRSDCKKLVNTVRAHGWRPVVELPEGNAEVDKLEKELGDHKITCAFLGSESEERDLQIELLIRNDIVEELEREIDGLRFERDKMRDNIIMDVDLRIAMEIDLYASSGPGPKLQE